MIYTACKKVITSESFDYVTDYEPMLRKLDLYLLMDRITEAQYTELKGLMDAKAPAA